MSRMFKTNSLFVKTVCCFLAVFHVISTGPVAEALCEVIRSANYRLDSYSLNQGSKNRGTAVYSLIQDSLGQAFSGKSHSGNYILESGFISTLGPNAPELIKPIPNFSWPENENLIDAFDLDDYIQSPAGLFLSFTVSGNEHLAVGIDSITNMVSFRKDFVWSGTEIIKFIATDTEGNTVTSNEVTLQLEGADNSPVIESVELSPQVPEETDKIILTVKAKDVDKDEVSFSFSHLFVEEARWQETEADNTYWYCRAGWQTGYEDSGNCSITVTASDPGGLEISREVEVAVANKNRPPQIQAIADITINETELVDLASLISVEDLDNEEISLSYSEPFEPDGTWLTDYDTVKYPDNEKVIPVTVTAFDGTDIVSIGCNVKVLNKNRLPQVSLLLDDYTVKPNENVEITITASDPDNEPLTFVLLKDNTPIESGSIQGTYKTSITFPGFRNYNLRAVVSDSGGLEANDEKIVDVVDTTINPNTINSIMGDFNGDALTDLGTYNSVDGTWHVCISDKGEFRSANLWLSGFGVTQEWWPLGGDFDGNGLSDIGIYKPGQGQMQVALSNGTKFTGQGPWLEASFASGSWQAFTGNFNADRFSDFALYNNETGEVRVALAAGSGFRGFTTWLSGSETNAIALGGDFNGDSLTDLCLFHKSSGSFEVFFSNASEFVDGSTWITGFAANKDPIIADFNNDGLADCGFWNTQSLGWHYAPSTGSGFGNERIWLGSFGSTSGDSATAGDFNGDGITDAAVFDREGIGIERWTTALSQDKPADLLIEADNGIGGLTQITYDYASKFENSLLPFPVYVAKTISLIDTMPQGAPYEAYSQRMQYSGGYFDPVEREFRGFEKVTVTDTSDPQKQTWSETYFYQGKSGQDTALKGKIQKIIAYDATGLKISESQNTYVVKYAGSSRNYLGFPALTETTTTVWEENQTSLTTKNTLIYDNIGNVKQTIHHGDAELSGDEKYSFTQYNPAYEAGYNNVSFVEVKDENQKTISRKSFDYFDNGSLREEKTWLYNPLTLDERWLSTYYSYDSFGNVESVTNSNNSIVTTRYETSYYTYPETVSNNLGHTISYEYDGRFGIVTKVTDANNVESKTTIDILGRVREEIDGFENIAATYNYPDFNTKITTQLNLETIEHVDGLGRAYKTESTTEDGQDKRKVITEVFYNKRGQVDKESLPYYENEGGSNISYVSYKYDNRGRVIKTTADFPGVLKDASSYIDYKEPLYTETRDPKNCRTGTKKDIWGNVTERIEFTSQGNYTTYYTYDAQGNLLTTKDSKDNITRIWYDSLGRKIQMHDPDMGVWVYEYDDVGNLVKQIDALEQTIEFEYDIINRLKKKSIEHGLSAVDLAIYRYDDDAKEYCTGRLSKVEDQSGQTEFFYDRLGRETKSVKTIDNESYTVKRTYDTLGRLETLTYPDNEVVSYSYDTNSGLLEKVTSNSIQAADYIKDITYDASGRIKTIQYGNSTTTSYEYGLDQRLSRILTQNPTRTLQDLHYDFDKNGNLITLYDNLRNNQREFDYDSLNRLKNAQGIPNQSGTTSIFTYNYDSIGNITYKSDAGIMKYGEGAGPHALTSVRGYIYTYDANGNMKTGRNKAFFYDSENRLTEVNDSEKITKYSYDGDGGRVKQSVIYSPQSAVEQTIYIGSLFEIATAEGTEGIQET
ncbi:MAG: toxin TcdB middle/N-terminal domain-containing protein, partial [Candidatus Omnitrophota bacterium]